MALAAIGFAKANLRQRIMAVSTSIGPGATNMVTSAALAHVGRLPVLLLPGDVFVTRLPDPVLQQVEDFEQGDVSANDCFRPVTRYFDRITRPEQLLVALPRAIQVLTDPAQCGPVCLALPQDVQTFAFDWPAEFFEPPLIRFRRRSLDVIAQPPSRIRFALNARTQRGSRQWVARGFRTDANSSQNGQSMKYTGHRGAYCVLTRTRFFSA